MREAPQAWVLIADNKIEGRSSKATLFSRICKIGEPKLPHWLDRLHGDPCADQPRGTTANTGSYDNGGKTLEPVHMPKKLFPYLEQMGRALEWTQPELERKLLAVGRIQFSDWLEKSPKSWHGCTRRLGLRDSTPPLF
jgi:hypothetical protein